MADEQNNEVDVVEMCQSDVMLFGRRKIMTTLEEITPDNVMTEVNKALSIHIQNLQEEEYLYWYRRGVQPILNRKKEIRPEICNKVVVNNASMVVTFKNGYFLTKPVSYISRSEDETVTEKVKQLNEYLYASGKNHADNELVDWFHTVGLGTLYVEPTKGDRPRKPVNVYAVDPRCAFCVYSMRPGNRTVLGINMVVDGNSLLVDAYTDKVIYRLRGGYASQTVTDGGASQFLAMVNELVKVEPNRIGMIPIIEYYANSNRMSSFECAIPLMNAINTVESNRADGVEQTIQQLCVAVNCQFEEGTTANKIRQAGMICLNSSGENKVDFKILESSIDQTDTQTTLDSLYDQMLEKCGVPSSVRDGGSTSDNVGAVYLRSGWAAADTDARNTEDCFRESNARFTEVFLHILEQKNLLTGLEPEDIDICFIRNDQNNTLAKAQAAVLMKQLGLSPELVLEKSGLSSDPISDVERSSKYIEMAWSNPLKTNGDFNLNHADDHRDEETSMPRAGSAKR